MSSLFFLSKYIELFIYILQLYPCRRSWVKRFSRESAHRQTNRQTHRPIILPLPLTRKVIINVLTVWFSRVALLLPIPNE